MVQTPWRLVYGPDGECLIPDELRRTPEKIAHAHECNERAKLARFDADQVDPEALKAERSHDLVRR